MPARVPNARASWNVAFATYGTPFAVLRAWATRHDTAARAAAYTLVGRCQSQQYMYVRGLRALAPEPAHALFPHYESSAASTALRL